MSRISLRPAPFWLVFPAIFLAVIAAHGPLLRLPYYWDEAGYYIPAAWDFFRTGALIPYSTLTNAHPPLPAIYLAVWWKLFGFSPLVTRTAMCFMAATMLTAVWRIALITTQRTGVALATIFLTALYPIVFAQSSLAHADLSAAAATLWGIAFLLRRTRSGLWLAVLCFSLAALCKETAIVTPFALSLWLVFRSGFQLKRVPQVSPLRPGFLDRFETPAILLTPLVPLILWYLYHWHRTGFVFGNPEYLRYNAGATLTPLRVLLAFAHRLLHVTAHMNLFVPVALMFACMLLDPRSEADGSPRPRISFADQAIFYVIIAANVLLFSAIGGALLTRYLLPLYPLIVLLCVNTFRRRLQHWLPLVALSAVAFITGLFVNPPYRFAPEDNLAYSNVIRLHQAAIAEIASHYSHDTVLTAWPATDELSKPELGYVQQPIKVTAIDNFSFSQIQKAQQQPETYSVAFLFSTKYDPPHLPLSLGSRNEQLDKRFFDFHSDLAPETTARILHGDIAWEARHKGQWAAVLHFDRAADAELQLPPRDAHSDQHAY
jgi:Dolichyl-phosphate-mannose-protein mannosyltransferase